MKKLLFPSVAILVLNSTALAQNTPQPSPDSSGGSRGPGVPTFWIRQGYRVDLAAENFGQARFLETDGKGTLFISQPSPGTVIALTDANNDGRFDNPKPLLTNQKRIHGLLFHEGFLDCAGPRIIVRIDPAKPADVTTVATFDLAEDGNHWYRTVLIDGNTLYTSVGDAGNINDEVPTGRQIIWKLNFDPATGKATHPTVFATGLRNTEKLRFRPGSREIWGADHGSDTIGARYGEDNNGFRGGPITDVLPPCEFNHYIQGLDYGHPFITGIGLPRPEYAGRKDILDRAEKNTPPAWSFGAHWAPNGWTFTSTDKLIPKGDALIAFHGSWNSRRKVGYRIEHVLFDPANNRPYGAQILVGTLPTTGGGEPLARPVDCLELPDGSVLFSDDHRNKLFRISKDTK